MLARSIGTGKIAAHPSRRVNAGRMLRILRHAGEMLRIRQASRMLPPLKGYFLLCQNLFIARRTEGFNNIRVNRLLDARGLLLLGLIASGILQACSGQLDPYAIQVLTFIAINVILAASLNFIIGETGQFSLCHAAFMGVGAYAGAAFSVFGGSLQTAASFPGSDAVFFLVALLLAGLAAAVTGLVIGLPSLRLHGDYLAIVTLGFGEMVRVLIQNADVVGGPRGFPGIPPLSNLFWAFGAACLTLYVLASLLRSTYGRGFLAVRDNEIAAEAMGINSTKFKVSAFTLGAFFAGIAGCLYAHTVQYLSPDGFGFLRSMEIVVMVILGGMGSLPGVVAAAIGLTLANEWLRELDQFRLIAYALIIILLMILRPQGLIGGWKIRAPWRIKQP